MFFKENLGHCLRVTDENGNDVAIIGPDSNPFHVEAAELLADTLDFVEYIATTQDGVPTHAKMQAQNIMKKVRGGK